MTNHDNDTAPALPALESTTTIRTTIYRYEEGYFPQVVDVYDLKRPGRLVAKVTIEEEIDVDGNARLVDCDVRGPKLGKNGSILAGMVSIINPGVEEAFVAQHRKIVG